MPSKMASAAPLGSAGSASSTAPAAASSIGAVVEPGVGVALGVAGPQAAAMQSGRREQRERTHREVVGSWAGLCHALGGGPIRGSMSLS